MKYISISEPVFYDLLTAKAQMSDIIELVNDPTFRPNAREWREFLRQIINNKKYGKIEEEDQ
jgi:hypothetical protein